MSSLIISELFPPCFSRSNNFNLPHSSLGSDDKDLVFEILGAETIEPGDLSYFVSVQARVGFLPIAFGSKFFSFAKSYNNFLSDNLARSTL